MTVTQTPRKPRNPRSRTTKPATARTAPRTTTGAGGSTKTAAATKNDSPASQRNALTVTQASANRRQLATLSYYLLAGSAFLLTALGLVMVLSASAITSMSSAAADPFGQFRPQAMFVVIGLIAAAVMSRIPVRVYRAMAWPALFIGLGLQALILTPLARGQGGNVNWVYLPGINQTIQPSEFLKLALALWLGAVLSRKVKVMHKVMHAIVPGLIFATTGLALVLLGHDMGTAVVVVCLIAGAYYVAGLPIRWFVVTVVAGAGIAAYLVFSSASRLERFGQFLGTADADRFGSGLQPLHGLRALGTGGISGVGLGASREKWNYLPEAHNDFIFAIIGEELGLVGSLLVLLLFGALGMAMLRIVARHKDPFVRITSGAVAAWILSQAIINIMVVIGLLPVIGVPLPLVSAGGSAVVATLMAVGMLLAFARTEPGARQALQARPGVVRRSMAVVSGRRSAKSAAQRY